jgi:hypothetical protein
VFGYFAMLLAKSAGAGGKIFRSLTCRSDEGTAQ